MKRRFKFTTLFAIYAVLYSTVLWLPVAFVWLCIGTVLNAGGHDRVGGVRDHMILLLIVPVIMGVTMAYTQAREKADGTVFVDRRKDPTRDPDEPIGEFVPKASVPVETPVKDAMERYFAKIKDDDKGAS